MALTIPLNVSASPQTIPLKVRTPIEQVFAGDYERLGHLPKINGVTLLGDKSAAELGAAAADLGITGASAGQVVTVSAVDVSGKPTAFAAATLLSAAGVSF